MRYFSLIFFISLFYTNTLIRIDNKEITKNDFIKRAEYTIRPSYCKSNNNIHKKIILNSIIAEKLMSLEIEENLLEENLSSNFLNGIKEQKMRELLLLDNVYSKIKLDSNFVNTNYENSLKTYKISYLSINNDTLAYQINSLINNNISFEKICYDYLKIKQIPKKEINFFEEHDPEVHKMIFSNKLEKGKLIGPIISKDKKILYIQINGWENNIELNPNLLKNQYELVKEKLYENSYNQEYDNYIKDIMHGKKLNFFENIFYDLVNETFKHISNSKSQKISLLNENSKIDPTSEFLKLDNKIYTVNDIEKLIDKHPLVFRNNDINSENYPQQFKYAIVDLIRDEHINNLAYDFGYDYNENVLKEVELFKDAALSNLHLQKYLLGKNISIDSFNNNYLDIIDEHLNDYIMQLFEKYSNDIYINFDLLDEIQLTHIDLFAYRKGIPYPLIVPNFPILTTKYDINYGNKLIPQ
tara:strand:- start:990 stop:2399 length:1410 start_codon:yes stop_codon:yes gene_type:complete